MGKYGFNENELVKTVTTMIDKDGFNKKVVTYGKPEPPKPAPIEVGTLSGANGSDATKFDVTLVVINVPEDADIYFKLFNSDDEYEFEVGDTIESSDLATYTEADTEISDIAAVMGVDAALTGGAKVYYQVYAVDAESVVLDKAKAEVDLS